MFGDMTDPGLIKRSFTEPSWIDVKGQYPKLTPSPIDCANVCVYVNQLRRHRKSVPYRI